MDSGLAAWRPRPEMTLPLASGSTARSPASTARPTASTHSGATATRPAHARTTAAGPTESGPTGAKAAPAESGMTPPAPPERAAPAEAAPPRITAPVPARATPPVIVPAIPPPAPKELSVLRCDELIGRIAQPRRRSPDSGRGRPDQRAGREQRGSDEHHDFVTHCRLPFPNHIAPARRAANHRRATRSCARRDRWQAPSPASDQSPRMTRPANAPKVPKMSDPPTR